MWFSTFPRDDGKEHPITENGRDVPKKGLGYVFTEEVMAAIDVAVGLGRPLLVSGEPGCGKTELGYAIARRLNIPRVHVFSTKSTSEARDLLYTYDAIGRFREAQLAEKAEQRDAADTADYIEFQALGRAILDAHEREAVEHLLTGRRRYSHPGEPSRSVVIIDEIDKAPRDFPNDLLREIEDLAFRIPELSRSSADGKDPETPGDIAHEKRPIVVITSNEERQLPDAFLRRCVFHEIAFPNESDLGKIVASGLAKRFTGHDRFELPPEDLDSLTKLMVDFRNESPEKRPGVSETIDAAILLAFPSPGPGGEGPPFPKRLPLIAPALAKLRNDRALLDGLIKNTAASRS